MSASPQTLRRAPVAVALDTHDLATATRWARSTAPYVVACKVGLELYLAHGTDAVRAVRDASGVEVFLDLYLPGKNPKEMDWVRSTEPGKGQRMRAVYEFVAEDEYRVWRRFARHPFVAHVGSSTVLGDARYDKDARASWCNLELRPR